ncbi:DUF4884 domain-containing protein [Rikenella microfusus]|uniref:DUF4884 domain-containing protein n=1 Tax=Rikenella microfusus TaxID=28139 RepID=A0A379MQ65_9BACT|nr:DUF4884 domain-containing protein [Rikenella microfusus]SUE33653.1 Uncharacterised protein [Rikenella microfusus]
MKKALLIILAAGLLGCVKSGKVMRPNDGNRNYSPKFLFEVDGVRVYRFYDGGRYIYFTNSTGRVSYTISRRGDIRHVETLCNNMK